MANTIKLKRGSGSDPSASDLAVGEVAIRTDEGKLFTKKDEVLLQKYRVVEAVLLEEVVIEYFLKMLRQ